MNTALIFAGGTGTRMKTTGRPKQFLEIYNKPIIIYTLEHFDQHPDIDNIVVVCLSGWIEYLKKQIDKFGLNKVKAIVEGGSTSQESTRIGLNTIAQFQNPKDTIVLIHDGVRPLINADVISKNIESVKKYGNAITVAPAIETIITTNDEGDANSVIDRNLCRLARAPQSFILEDIIKMHERAMKDHYDKMIDSASLMIHYGEKLHLVNGPSENMKITTPSDFYVFRAILEAKENSQIWGL